jgi:alpha-1,3-rhamnosyl/mannosyltransferase
MHIIVNALPLTGLLTGISRYVRCLYSQVQQLPDMQVSYFNGTHALQEMPRQAEPGSWSRRTERIWGLPDAVVLSARSLHWLNFERLMRKACRQNHFSIYHETAFVPVAISDIPVVYTLHDLSLIKHSSKHPRERVWFFKLFFKRRLPYATHIITVSEFMRNEIIEDLKIHPDAITAIHEAPDPGFCPRSKEKITQMLEHNEWPREYILFVGTLEPRKNIAVLIKALARMKNKIPLILAGWQGWGDKQWLNEIKKLGLDKRIYIANYVDEETLACLYSGAHAFVYPSVYEGFGLPVLEAMACGCPVVCSNVSSLPEVAGDAALYITPHDHDELAHTLDMVIGDDSIKEVLIERGLLRAQQFSWQKTAQQTVNLFMKIAEQHRVKAA